MKYLINIGPAEYCPCQEKEGNLVEVTRLYDSEGQFFNGSPLDYPVAVFCPLCGAGDPVPDDYPSGAARREPEVREELIRVFPA